MDPIVILFIAMAIVVGGIVFVRLHAFVALLIGAIVVALLTPRQSLQDSETLRYAARVTQVNDESIRVKPAKGQPAYNGDIVIVRRDQERKTLAQIGSARLVVFDAEGDNLYRLSELSLSNDAAINGNSLRAGDFVLTTQQHSAVKKTVSSGIGNRIATGFGQTCTKIGILIALAAIVGVGLLESGAAERIVQWLQRCFGEKRTPVAFTVSGFVVGIPVFFDTVFYLLLPLAKALYRKTQRNYLLYILTIVIGASMAHSLVPPTPGPLLVAAELDINLTKMILAGCIVGLFSVTAGFLTVLLLNSKIQISMPDGLDEEPTSRNETDLPPLWLSVLPIFLPMLLLATRTAFGKQLASLDSSAGRFSSSLVDTLGNPNIALGIAAAIALAMLYRSKPKDGQESHVGTNVQQALASAGMVILITAIGGAFGHVLRQTGIATALQDRFPATASGLVILFVAFGITAVVRVAQGSATVAMITSIGIVAPLAATVDLPFDTVYLAMAVGCGSKPLPWMNDSGFWVVTKMAGMTERQGLSTITVSLTVMGVVGFLVTLAGAVWLPLK